MAFSRTVVGLGLAMLTCATCLGQGLGAQLNGHWAPDPYVRRVPQADLIDEITADVLRAQVAADAYAVRWCNAVGMPAMMDADLDIRVSQRLMIIASQSHSYPRYVYFDLPPRDPEILDPTSVGYSDGHWDGSTLVVDTYGFAGFDYRDPSRTEVRGVTTIPGGGFRSPQARLTERFSLTDDGKTLIVEATWSDPTVFARSQSYTYRYHRRAPTYEPAAEQGCDPFDAERADFLTARRVSN